MKKIKSIQEEITTSIFSEEEKTRDTTNDAIKQKQNKKSSEKYKIGEEGERKVEEIFLIICYKDKNEDK